MAAAIAEYGLENVFIVTARAEAQPVVEFLQSFSITVPEVVATAGSAGKAPWLTRKLLINKYTRVIVYEDCRKNIKMLRDVVEAYNEELSRNVLYSAVCILPDGSQQIVEKKIRNLVRRILISSNKDY